MSRPQMGAHHVVGGGLAGFGGRCAAPGPGDDLDLERPFQSMAGAPTVGGREQWAGAFFAPANSSPARRSGAACASARQLCHLMREVNKCHCELGAEIAIASGKPPPAESGRLSRPALFGLRGLGTRQRRTNTLESGAGQIPRAESREPRAKTIRSIDWLAPPPPPPPLMWAGREREGRAAHDPHLRYFTWRGRHSTRSPTNIARRPALCLLARSLACARPPGRPIRHSKKAARPAEDNRSSALWAPGGRPIDQARADPIAGSPFNRCAR